MLLLLATIFEWIMGNFLSMMVMGMFAVFWLSFGVLQTPTWAIAAAYSATGNAAEGAVSLGYDPSDPDNLKIWVNPFNPCLPDPASRTCPRFVGSVAFAPYIDDYKPFILN